MDGGAGGTRTRVRTKRRNAFYMLIHCLGFRAQDWFSDPHICALSPEFHLASGASCETILKKV